MEGWKELRPPFLLSNGQDARFQEIERSETSDEIFNQFQTTAETPGAEPYELSCQSFSFNL